MIVRSSLLPTHDVAEQPEESTVSENVFRKYYYKLCTHPRVPMTVSVLLGFVLTLKLGNYEWQNYGFY